MYCKPKFLYLWVLVCLRETLSSSQWAWTAWAGVVQGLFGRCCSWFGLAVVVHRLVWQCGPWLGLAGGVHCLIWPVWFMVWLPVWFIVWFDQCGSWFGLVLSVFVVRSGRCGSLLVLAAGVDRCGSWFSCRFGSGLVWPVWFMVLLGRCGSWLSLTNVVHVLVWPVVTLHSPSSLKWQKKVFDQKYCTGPFFSR